MSIDRCNYVKNIIRVRLGLSEPGAKITGDEPEDEHGVYAVTVFVPTRPRAHVVQEHVTDDLRGAGYELHGTVVKPADAGEGFALSFLVRVGDVRSL